MRLGIVSALSFILVTSCSIKEDRMDCACILTVDMSSCSELTDNVSLTLLSANQAIAGNYIPGGDPRLEYAVTKGECYLSAFFGAASAVSGAVTVNNSEQFPEVFAFASRFLAFGETAEQRVSLHKQYACITLDLSESGWSSPDYTLDVYGNICGFTLKDMSPLEGAFYYRIPYNPSSRRSFRVPRQSDDSLKLSVLDGSGRTFELNIGEMLAEKGFDWTAEDLGDAVLSVSSAEYAVSVRPSDWDSVVSINVTI